MSNGASAAGGPPGWADGCRVGFRPCSYDPDVFSPRVRAHLPCRHLLAAGVQADIVPPDGSGTYDVVVFQKAYAKRDLGLAADLAARGTKVVFDLCDNHFFHPEPRPEHADQTRRLREMIARADVVSVSTAEIAKLIHDKATFVVDDAVELPPIGTGAERRAAAKRRRRAAGRPPVRVVWQGQHGTRVPRSGIYSLSKVVPHLEALHQQLPLRLTVIGNSKDAFRSVLGDVGIPVRYRPWRLRTFAGHFKDNDVCVIPNDVNPFTVCKSNNRVVLALMMGVPVVADPIPSYRELSGFVTFAGPDGGWAEAVRAYWVDPDLADDHVADGQRYIRTTYTPQRVVDQWSQVLRAALRSGASA
jgi:glycosyltransferase involved in cell wall biosynthesis